MANRRLVSIWIAAAAALVPATACSAAARYRLLSFFFDGVPQPGARPAGPAAPAAGPTAGQPEAGVPRRRVLYKHAPWREGRCRDCHNPDDTLLYRTPQEGLCEQCHSAIPGPVAYVHGPVAIKDCLACHDPHLSAHRRLLRDDAKVICYRCHEEADLTEGRHHEAIETVLCIECHSPHGGSDRFFLKRSQP